MNILEILGLVLVHWMADYCLQTEAEGLGKSKSFKLLISHTWTYSLTMFSYIVWLYVFSVVKINIVFWFFPITFVLHTATDFCTSRLTSYYFKKSKMYGFPGFWTTIGFDQVLHLFQLFITYYLFK